MTVGLRIRNAQGQVMFDLTDRFTRIMGSRHIAARSTGSVTVDAQFSGDIWFQFFSDEPHGFTPTFTVSGNIIRWTFTGQKQYKVAASGTLLYGRY